MKRIILILLFIYLHCTFMTEHCEAQWVKVSNGMGSGNYVFSLMYNANKIFAGTWQGGCVTTNNGNNWSVTLGQMVYSFTLNGNDIYAGTGGNGVFVSTNTGNNWTLIGLKNRTICSMAANINKIFAGTYGYGVYFTTNNGTNWIQTMLSTKNVWALVVKDNYIFAGVSTNGVLYSPDNGVNWDNTSLNNKTVYSLLVSDNNIYAGTMSSGIYKSTNNGINWIHIGLNNEVVQCIAKTGNNIFAGTDTNGFFYSSNNGANWIQSNEGLGSIKSIHALLISNNYIFAGTFGDYVWRRPLSDLIGIKKISTEVPKDFELGQNYPNPFNAVTSIKFKVTSGEDRSQKTGIRLRVYDLNGREIRTLVDEELEAGVYEVRFDAGELPSGVYFYRMEAGSFSETRKLILLK